METNFFITFLTVGVLPYHSEHSNTRITLYVYSSDGRVLNLNKPNKKVRKLMGITFWNWLIYGENSKVTLREKSPYSEFFWFVFPRIQTE